MRYKTFLAATAAFALAACADAPTSSAPVAAGPRLIQSQFPNRPIVLISQVYGGGGNSGATIKNDFIELHNPGSTAVSVAGWSVQYGSATGTTISSLTPLTGSIPAGGYYLIKQAPGAGGTVDLIAHQDSGAIAMGANGGKVLLVSNTVLQSGQCPVGAQIIDAVAYGTSNCGDGVLQWGTPTAATAAATAAIRNSNGCAWTGVAGTDFTVTAPAPRNAATAAVQCAVTQPIGPIKSITLTPPSASTIVGGTQQFTATGKDANGATIAGATFTWQSSNTVAATVDGTGKATAIAPGSANIIATSVADPTVTAIATFNVVEAPTLPSVRFSEIHYDNSDTDVGEAIEIEGPAGTDLTGWSIVLYNGNGGARYDTRVLSGILSNQCTGRGVLVAQYVTNGIQNGGTAAAPQADGFALVNKDGVVVEFLSYEGTMTAIDGPAKDMVSRDIVAKEEPAPAIGTTLQRSLADTWAAAPDNFGGCNGRTAGVSLPSITFTGRAPADVALPVGFQSQIFANVRRNGAASSESVVWSSDTPALASIDSRGVITSLGAGTAIFRAKTTDGLTENTYSLPMTVATAWAAPTYAGNTEFGDPNDGDATDEIVLRRAEYTTSFSKTRHIPNWASYNLDASQRGSLDRCDCFTFDPELIAQGMTPYNTADYTGSGAWWNAKYGNPTSSPGIDRGHLVRSFDRTQGTLDNARTFYFANIVPQFADNNQGPWAQFENALGDSSTTREVYIIAGASGSLGTLKDEGNITIPSAMWKVALIAPRNARLADITSLSGVTVMAVIMPNVNGIRNIPWSTYLTTVDAVEMLSGYDVLSLLRDDLEAALESGTKPPKAAINGPFTSNEGSSVAMSGSGSTDPDAGQTLTYAWSFGDGSSATGVNTSHTYADNGSYSVRLIVTDPVGLADTTTTTATVNNVAPTVVAFAGASLVAGETFSTNGSFTDPGSDSWTATVDYGDGSGVAPLTLNVKTFALSHQYDAAGTYTVTVIVRDDDTGSNTRTAVVTVLSETQALASASAAIDALIGVGRINRGTANSLKVKLDNAAKSFDKGNPTPAINQAQAALNELDAMVRSGSLTEQQAAAARLMIQRAIASMSR